MQVAIDWLSWLVAWLIVFVGTLVVMSMILAGGIWLLDRFLYRKNGRHCWWFLAYTMWKMKKGKEAKFALRTAIEADEYNQRKDTDA